MAESSPKTKNPFLKRIKHLNEYQGPTPKEVGRFLWGDERGPAPRSPLPVPRPQGGRDG